MTKIKTSFSGHDKFDCKIDWITKGLEAYKEDNSIFIQANIEQTIAKLGLGSNMVKSLNHWMKVFTLIDGGKLTVLGQTILEKDPYLENSDTLWILHWNLVKQQEKATLYNLFFNRMYPHKFAKDDIIDYVTSWLNDNNINLSPTTIESDIDVFIRMYNNKHDDSHSMSLLSELNIITKISQSNYSLNINAVTNISDELFLYILCDYIEMQHGSNVTSISIDDLQRGKLSIQKSLCMSEHSLYSKIDKLSELTDNKFIYSETAGIRQVYISEKMNKSVILDRIYG
ncbi:MAG: Unknown protein [uncultured Sulfurovum sp.]|uniref:DUF4007 domain-containing protein n=1 Tax=uncultured Sulfurovum sp. TaxID=269237 RepID=A0A6S6TEK9_9BACT|nr:MAG: Unknown protein [uncultured Sulfurovum sp.]